ncbi:MAG: rRNA maturation RNase YbeY [Candidatus Liptonbacteria bacterium]|nr:rRNA maturation RNase YbeY [Candidatus Liptonbacteria bacterium]
MINKVKVFVQHNRYQNFENPTRRVAKETLRILKKEGLVLEINLVDSRRMRFLNKKFRGKNVATNVLSFEGMRKGEFFEPGISLEKGWRDLGEIYLNPGYILKQKEDLGRMVIHGILHLLGYQHDKKDDTIRMEKLEKSLKGLIRVGFS